MTVVEDAAHASRRPIREQVTAAFVGIFSRDPDAFVAMLADDAVLEFPLDPDEARRAVTGKAAIAERMSAIRDACELDETAPTRIFVDEAAETVFVEAAATLRMSPDTPRYAITQAVVVEFRDGQAVRWTDYRANYPLT